MVKPNMLKLLSTNSVVLLLLSLTACVSAPTVTPSRDVDATTTTAPTPDVADAATSVVAPAIVRPIVTLSPSLQRNFDDGVAALNAKQFERALQRFAAVQIAQADYAPAYLNAALAERGLGRLDRARAQLDGALTAGVRDVRVMALMGLIERERGQFLAAKTAYEDAIKLDISYAPAHRNLAVLADLYLHDVALAYAHMEKYIQLMPDDKQASGWLAELKRRAGIKSEPTP